MLTTSPNGSEISFYLLRGFPVSGFLKALDWAFCQGEVASDLLSLRVLLCTSLSSPQQLHHRQCFSSGCYNKTLQTAWLKNNRNLFLTVLEAGSLRLGCQHGWGRALFWGADFLLCPHMVEGARELSQASFIRAQSPKARSPNTITSRIQISTSEAFRPEQAICCFGFLFF